MKKKTLLFSSLGVLLALSTVACGPTAQTSNPTSNGGDTTSGSETHDKVYDKFYGELERNVEIKVLENDTAIKMGYFDEMIEAFNEKYKEYGIKAVDANIGEFNDLATSGPYGYGPDVLYQANDILMKYVDQKHITPLPLELLEAAEHVPAEALKAYKAKVKGKEYTFGVPINIQSGLLYYRKDLLPEDWKETYDKDKNNVPDMIENAADLYKFSKERHAKNPEQFGFEYSINDFYFSSGFLFSYGAYMFGDENTNTKDIGLDKNNAKLGGQLLRQFASSMSVSCIDDSAKLAISGNMAKGKYFASMTTPDVRSVIIDATATQYLEDKKVATKEEGIQLAEENIIGVPFPRLPKNGDLEHPSEETVPCIQMGGINGYAVSSYTKAPKAALAFVNFATSYEMVKLREKTLQIAPCRDDVSSESNQLSKALFENVVNGIISIMPSTSAFSQVWTPAGSFLSDLAADPTRAPGKYKFDTLDKIQAGLTKCSKDIYDAINILG